MDVGSRGSLCLNKPQRIVETSFSQRDTTLRRTKLASDHFKSGFSVISGALLGLGTKSPTDLEESIARYSQGYLALRALIRDRTDPHDEMQLLATAHAVYGWMPTILKKVNNLLQMSNFVIGVRGLSFADAHPIVERMATLGPGSVFFSLNNSVVGTSKLLHFLLPDLFPIWDSRIARLFNFKNASHNRPLAYLSYFELLHHWRYSGGILPQELLDRMQVQVPRNDPLSDLRLIEYALFLASISNFGEDITDSE
jgi:hypothetical protein